MKLDYHDVDLNHAVTYREYDRARRYEPVTRHTEASLLDMLDSVRRLSVVEGGPDPDAGWWLGRLHQLQLSKV